MHSTASKAIHGFIILPLRQDRLVGDPALHPQAGLGAAVKERGHYIVLKSRDRNRAGAEELQWFSQAACLRVTSLGVLPLHLHLLIRFDPDQRSSLIAGHVLNLLTRQFWIDRLFITAGHLIFSRYLRDRNLTHTFGLAVGC
jgi:hypothetical protein